MKKKKMMMKKKHFMQGLRTQVWKKMTNEINSLITNREKSLPFCLIWDLEMEESRSHAS